MYKFGGEGMRVEWGGEKIWSTAQKGKAGRGAGIKMAVRDIRTKGPSLHVMLRIKQICNENSKGYCNDIT